MKTYSNLYDRIISPENLFEAWYAFRSDKRNKRDVLEFEWRLEERVFALHRELVAGTYRHGRYEGFFIRDPKQRHIHKAAVRDRVLHHAIFSVINPIFEETFIHESFSCRVGYGTHYGVEVMGRKIRQVAQNGTRPCFVLKCDVQKFFDSVDHRILLKILARRITDPKVMRLLEGVVHSFSNSSSPLFGAKGIPIGNLTSQLFANVYMNEFDQFVKHKLRVKNYGRYTDDFLVVSSDREYLRSLLPAMEGFLSENLSLKLHPKKIEIRKLSQGIDYLGYTTFLQYRQVRTRTKQRMFTKMRERLRDYRSGAAGKESVDASVNSYLGVLSHANAFKLKQRLLNSLWLWS